jgi:hypothetical protein
MTEPRLSTAARPKLARPRYPFDSIDGLIDAFEIAIDVAPALERSSGASSLGTMRDHLPIGVAAELEAKLLRTLLGGLRRPDTFERHSASR